MVNLCIERVARGRDMLQGSHLVVDQVVQHGVEQGRLAIYLLGVGFGKTPETPLAMRVQACSPSRRCSRGYSKLGFALGFRRSWDQGFVAFTRARCCRTRDTVGFSGLRSPTATRFTKLTAEATGSH